MAPRVVPMFIMNNSVLREVLLIWMSNLSIRVRTERVAVHTREADMNRHPGWVDDEFVAFKGFAETGVAGLGVVELLLSGRAVLGRNQVARLEDLKVPVEQRALEDALSQEHGQRHALLDHLVPLELHLPTADVE